MTEISGTEDMPHRGTFKLGDLFVHKFAENPSYRGGPAYTRYYLSSTPHADDLITDRDEGHFPVLAMVGGDAHPNKPFQMSAMAVHPHHAGRGHGRTLLGHVVREHGNVETSGTVSDTATAAFSKLGKEFQVQLGEDGKDAPHRITLNKMDLMPDNKRRKTLIHKPMQMDGEEGYPTGTQIYGAGKVKVMHSDENALGIPNPKETSWVEMRDGMVMSNDGHPISSRNQSGK